MPKIYKYRLFFTICLLFYTANLIAQVETEVVKSQIDSSAITPKNNQQVDEMISFAKKFLGTPYHYSGMTPSGFDCSGFIAYIFGNFGIPLIHSSYGMAELGKTVKLDEIQPGDLMFFKGRSLKSNQVGHVAMVVEVTPDAIKFIHSSTSRGVVIDNFKSSKYYIPRYITSKRLDYGVSDEKIIKQK